MAETVFTVGRSGTREECRFAGVVPAERPRPLLNVSIGGVKMTVRWISNGQRDTPNFGRRIDFSGPERRPPDYSTPERGASRANSSVGSSVVKTDVSRKTFSNCRITLACTVAHTTAPPERQSVNLVGLVDTANASLN
jgi:hypothetical protein